MTILDGLLIHPMSKKQAGYFLQRPTNSLLIFGEGGSGKLSLAMSMACELLGLKAVKQLSTYPYLFHAKKSEGKQDISIETVREIIRFLRLKTTGDSSVRRIIIIEDAHLLSDEGQNALLKVLEEPNDDSVFLLTAINELSLLPTIVSRCQHIWTYPVSQKIAAGQYAKRYDSKKLESAWMLSQGNAALLDALLTDGDAHPLKLAIKHAKSFLSNSKYERLGPADALAKDSREFGLFLEALAKILAALHLKAINQNRPTQTQRLLADRKLVLAASEALDNNVSPRLISLNLVLNLNT